MRAGLIGLVAAAAVFVGGAGSSALAEPADFPATVDDKGCAFNCLRGFFGRKKVDCPNYVLELSRGQSSTSSGYLFLNVRDSNNEVEIFDFGSDGLGHPGDYAIVTHKFKDGSKLFMELKCREGWKYGIKSKLFEGTNCVSQSEFDPFKISWIIRPVILLEMDPPRIYGAIAFRNLVDSAYNGNEPIEVPYGLLNETFENIWKDIPLVRSKKLTLNEVLKKHSDPLIAHARERIIYHREKRRLSSSE